MDDSRYEGEKRGEAGFAQSCGKGIQLTRGGLGFGLRFLKQLDVGSWRTAGSGGEIQRRREAKNWGVNAGDFCEICH